MCGVSESTILRNNLVWYGPGSASYEYHQCVHYTFISF